MPAKLHIPVIGSGSIGTRHYNNLIELDVSSELLSFRQTGVAGVESRLKLGADGVVIATATGIRNEIVSICAALDIPMYIEKPLAVTGDQVVELYQICPTSLQQRSVAGYMMRYHPLFRRLCEQMPDDIYRFNLTIGHDVNQWRSNWRFSESYAATPQGGGVLLDLCHELDMAHTLFPTLEIRDVNSLGHIDHPGVDFSTQISLAGNSGISGTVSMDYLSPVSTRTANFFGLERVIRVDMNTLSFQSNDGHSVEEETIEFERNDMFINSLKDFIRLVQGATVNDWCPRLDCVKHSAQLIAAAWQQRHFTGNVGHSVL